MPNPAPRPPFVPDRGWQSSDPGAEAVMAKLGVRWELHTIPLNLIDFETSFKNNARPIALDPNTVEDYRCTMERGDDFPPIVVYRTPRGEYVTMGGNHRIEAARLAGRATVAAYVVQVTDVGLRDLLTQTLNVPVGQRPAHDDFVAQAVAHMQEYNTTPKLAAERYGITENSIRKAIRERTQAHRFRAAGISNEGLRKKAIEYLCRIDNDPAFVQAHGLIKEAKLPDDKIEELVNAIREQRTEGGQLAVIQQFAERDDIRLRLQEVAVDGPGRRQAPSPAQKLTGLLKQSIRMYTQYPSRGRMGLTSEDDYQKVGGLIAQLAEHHATLPVRAQ